MTSAGLRLGIFRDRPVFEASGFDDLVVPAHIAAMSGDGLWGFLQGVAGRRPGMRYFYDPMSYLVWLDPRYWARGSEVRKLSEVGLPLTDEAIRPGFRRLLEAYGLLDVVTASGTNTAMVRATAIERLPASCIKFQRRGSNAKKAKTIAKYAGILGLVLEDDGFIPDRIVAPYRGLEDLEGSISDQAALNASSLAEGATDEELWCVVALASPRLLSGIGASEFARLRVGEFEGVGLWVGDLDEHEASLETLRRYRSLVQSIARPVWLLFGGYFGLLLAPDGVQLVTHGVFYTESKSLRGPVGSGPAADRYYIERLHRFFEPARALSILRVVPEWRCPCPECGPLDELTAALVAAPTDAETRMAWTQRLQRHFLGARAREVEAVNGSSRDELVAGLTATLQAAASVPLADQVLLQTASAHLTRWRAALR